MSALGQLRTKWRASAIHDAVHTLIVRRGDSALLKYQLQDADLSVTLGIYST